MEREMNLPITRELLHLANAQLAAIEKENLALIIDELWLSLDQGHSCIQVAALVNKLNLSARLIQELLIKSNLAIVYLVKPTTIEPLPIAYLCLASGDLIYISKYLAYELSLVKSLHKLLKQDLSANSNQYAHALAKLHDLSRLTNRPNAEQLVAILNSASERVSIITGGPGTGKTTTVMLLLWLFYQLYGNELKVKICAPTGKAAIRVRESMLHSVLILQQQQPSLALECFSGLFADNSSFATIHKLLGSRYNNIYFKHNVQLPLDIEVVIIDESSMVGLPLFSKLVSALSAKQLRHVVFLGDKNQLSSVEEGYVFASLINHWQLQQDNLTTTKAQLMVSELITSNRNQGEVHQLALAMLNANAARLVSLLANGDNVKLYPAQLYVLMANLFRVDGALLQYFAHINNAQTKLNVSELFKLLREQITLSLTKKGVLGCENLNRQIERKVKQHFVIHETWYSGRPIIILSNDASLNLFNGDIGICVVEGDEVQIVFEDERKFAPERLNDYALAYAITIHKAQGSEYNEVNVILANMAADSLASSLLSRELLYTAVTRAKQKVNLFSEMNVILAAINCVTKRNTGLVEFLN